MAGNRKATVSQESIEIIDLDKEAVTHVDLLKHTYYTMTFAEMRARMEAARAEAEKEAAKQEKQQQPKQDASNPNVQASFDVKVRNTGAHKTVSGLDTKESILTMTMIATDKQTQQSGSIGITNDMWMVEAIPGYDQVADFDRRYAEKLAVVMGVGGQDFSRMMIANPGAGEAMGKMAVEMQKLHGVPVTQIMRMGATPDGEADPRGFGGAAAAACSCTLGRGFGEAGICEQPAVWVWAQEEGSGSGSERESEYEWGFGCAGRNKRNFDGDADHVVELQLGAGGWIAF